MTVGLPQFLVFAFYYIIIKSLILFINVETRRNGWRVPAGVSGLLS